MWCLQKALTIFSFHFFLSLKKSKGSKANVSKALLRQKRRFMAATTSVAALHNVKSNLLAFSGFIGLNPEILILKSKVFTKENCSNTFKSITSTAAVSSPIPFFRGWQVDTRQFLFEFCFRSRREGKLKLREVPTFNYGSQLPNKNSL